ncbi:MAG: hypothetical protein ABGZ53_20950 [Fuerstiella sp.]
MYRESNLFWYDRSENSLLIINCEDGRRLRLRDVPEAAWNSIAPNVNGESRLVEQLKSTYEFEMNPIE